MRDGVELLTDIYAPVSWDTAHSHPPRRAIHIALLTAGYYYATHGYHLVNQSCCGTFGSGGDFEPFRPDVDAGADTVAWLRKPAWFGGRFALCGASYLGYTAWALMTDPPPELAAAVIAVSAHEAWIRGASARPRTRNGFRRQPDAVPGVAHVTGCGGPVWRPMRLDQAFERVNIPSCCRKDGRTGSLIR
jgi:predicted acyl esterase